MTHWLRDEHNGQEKINLRELKIKVQILSSSNDTIHGGSQRQKSRASICQREFCHCFMLGMFWVCIKPTPVAHHYLCFYTHPPFSISSSAFCRDSYQDPIKADKG